MERINTIQPFVKGDVFVGCTWLNNPDDDHRGYGRIIQYDEDLNEKGVLWLDHSKYFIVGNKFGPDGVLWAFDCHDHQVLHIGPDGVQKPPHHFADRAFGSVNFTSTGDIYFGEYFIGTKIHQGTTAKLIPGTDLLGHGNIHHYDRDWNFVEELEVDTAKELTGFKGVTHSVLHPDEQFITYTAETSKRILRYDICNKQQMPDLATQPGDNIYDGNWFIALHYLRDKNLLVTRSDYFEIYDEQGQVQGRVDLDRYGWAQITTSPDDRFAYSGNVWTGGVCKVDLAAGKVVAYAETSQADWAIERQKQQDAGTWEGPRAPRRAVAGIAVYPG
jgi:hypothetical protein